MKRILFFAMAVGLLAGCANDEFDGGNNLVEQNNNNAIAFGIDNQAITRANTALETFEGTMKIYGAKLKSTAYEKAFGNYAVWNTSNNPSTSGDWEYVAEKDDKKTVIKDGKAGAANNFTVPQKQTIKYWDYDAYEYLFWGISPYLGGDSVTYTVAAVGNVSKAEILGADGHLTVNKTATAKKIKNYYISNPIKVESNNYAARVDGKDAPVRFIFGNLNAKVRVGFYETMPGYKVVDMKFYDNSATPVLKDSSVYFCRTNEAFFGAKAAGKTVLTYDNDDLGYSISYSGMTAQKYIQFGKLNFGTTAMSTSASAPSYGTDGDMGTSNYFSVLPTPTALFGTEPITIIVDYIIQGEDADAEKLTIHKATATIPAAYASWKPGHAYSYIFKITNKPNGSTGTSVDDPKGLYPIEFDAQMSSILDEQTGTTTLMSTTSITTYQNGSVVTEGVVYQPSVAVDVMLQQAATPVTPTNANLQVYKLAGSYDYSQTLEQNIAGLTPLTISISGNKATISASDLVAGKDVVIVYTDSDPDKSAFKVIDL